MNRFPDSPLLNVFVVMSVDAAGTGNILPGDFGKPFLECGRQSPRRLGNNFETARSGVESFVVAKEAVKIEAMNETHGASNVVAYVL